MANQENIEIMLIKGAGAFDDSGGPLYTEYMAFH